MKQLHIYCFEYPRNLGVGEKFISNENCIDISCHYFQYIFRKSINFFHLYLVVNKLLLF